LKVQEVAQAEVSRQDHLVVVAAAEADRPEAAVVVVDHHLAAEVVVADPHPVAEAQEDKRSI
jgi:acetyl-CoA acetyltransferase